MENKYPIKEFLGTSFTRNNIGRYVLPYSDVFEFGVHLGETLKEICSSCDYHNRCIRKVFGFDSFIGLPLEDSSTPFPNTWRKGEFNSSKDLGGSSLDETLSILQNRIGYPVTFVPGFYKKLSSETIKQYDIKQAGLIHIDCDLYISAFQALDFCFSNKLVFPGTIIIYDDWGHPGFFNAEFKEFEFGESKAHKEITEKYGIVWKRLCGYAWEFLGYQNEYT